MMTFSFRPDEPVAFALERRVGEDLGGLLEGGRREERLGRQRGLGDPEDDLLALAGVPPSALVFLLSAFEAAAILQLPREQAGRALRLNPHLLQHLAGDQLDVLVVDVDALGAVHLLHLVDQVDLDRGTAADRQQVGRVERAVVELLTDLDLVAVGDVEAGPQRERVARLFAARLGDDHFQGFVGFVDRDFARGLGHLGKALRFTRLEELDDARQTLRDVLRRRHRRCGTYAWSAASPARRSTGRR